MNPNSRKLLSILALTISLPLCGMGGEVMGYLLLFIALAGFVVGLVGGVVAGLKRVKNSIGFGATYGLFVIAGMVCFYKIMPGPVTFSELLNWIFVFAFAGGLPLLIGYWSMTSFIRYLKP